MEITPSLQATLEHTADDELVDVVVELEHPAEGNVAARRSAFASRSQAVEERIEAAHGEVVGRAWINSTLVVRVPACAVADVAGADGVVRVDVPHEITRG